MWFRSLTKLPGSEAFIMNNCLTETNADAYQIKTQTKTLAKHRLNAVFSNPIQPHVGHKKLSEEEKFRPPSGGSAMISSLPLREFDIGQKDRIYSEKTRLLMSTVKSQSLEISLWMSCYIQEGFSPTESTENE